MIEDVQKKDGVSHPRFLTAETDGIILPWVAPKGIPYTVLCRVRQWLLYDFHKTVLEYALDSSPYRVENVRKGLRASI